MSLVNRMLKDIESRQTPVDSEPKAERLRQLALTTAAARPCRSVRIWWLCLLLIIGSIACWLLY